MRLERTEMELTDSKTVRVIGEGTFSEVHIVQNVDTGRIYAVKALKREEMLKKDQVRLLYPLFTLYVTRHTHPTSHPPSLHY